MFTQMSSEQNDLPSTQPRPVVPWRLSLLEMQEDQRSEVQGLCDLESELLVPSPLDPAAQPPTPESTLPGFSWPPLSDPKGRASIGENGAWMSPTLG